MTPEEKALREIWLDRLRELGGAHEAVRFADIQLRDAREAVQRAAHDHFALCKANERRCGVLDALREGEGEELEVQA